jgi:enoyl-CoA hydratase/carnithine racemase
MTQVLVSTDGPVCTLAINRPEALNALTNAVLGSLLDALNAACNDRGVRAIVLTGMGEKAFCSGIDLAERGGLDEAGKAAQSQAVLKLVRAVHDAPKPVIASVGGWCLGAGLELALGCDLRIASQAARFAFPEMSLGAYPGGGGAVLLPRVIGRAKALDWLMAPRRLDAAEALTMGLVTRVVPADELTAATRKLAGDTAQLAPRVAAALKASINEGLDLPLSQAFDADQALRRPLDATRDYLEGLAAAREKRPAQFTGE